MAMSGNLQAIMWRLKYVICVVMVMKCSAVFSDKIFNNKISSGGKVEVPRGREDRF